MVLVICINREMPLLLLFGDLFFKLEMQLVTVYIKTGVLNIILA